MSARWTYADYRSVSLYPEPATRHQRATLHMVELSEELDLTLADGAQSRESSTIEAAIARVHAYLDELERRFPRLASPDSGPRAIRARFRP